MRKLYIFISAISSFLVLAFSSISIIGGAAAGAVYVGYAAMGERYGDAGIALGKNFPFVMHVNDMGTNGGNREDSGVTFFVNLGEEGFYDLDVYYMSGSKDRYFELSINDESFQKVMCEGDDWDAVNQTRVQIPLEKGLNTLRFGNEEWYAPNLCKIIIFKAEGFDIIPDTEKNTADIESFNNTNIVLNLDKANGTYTVSKNGEILLKNAFAAAVVDGVKLFSQDYSTHNIIEGEDYISFIHKKDGAPDMTQRFYLKDGYLLTDMALSNSATSWISPLYTNNDESLRGGTKFLQVPFDNDNYDSYEIASVNSLDKSYEMTALINDENGSAIVIGSVSHDTWKTGIEWRGLSGKVKNFYIYGGVADSRTRDTQPHGTVSGETVLSPTVFIGKYDDWRDGLTAYGKANADVAAPLAWNETAPIGWSSWGVVQDKLTKEIAFATSDYYKEELSSVWQEDGDAIYINLDAYWNHVLLSDEDMRAFVEYCEANGQKAGIYHTPFVSWSSAKDLDGTDIYEALLRDADGNILPTWDGALALDVTHPIVIDQIKRDIQRFIDAGFSYIKMDFLSHGAMEGVHYDKSVQTGTQAYNQAMSRIEKQIDGKMFINLSIAPIFPYQYAHGRRLACDTFYSIGSTKYLLNSFSYGFWQKEIYACPDPDHIVIWGSEGQAGENEARARVTSGIIVASFLAGDNFAGNKDNTEAKERFDLLLKNPDIMKLARNNKSFTPAELPTDSAANIYYLKDGAETYIAVFNFESTSKSFTLDLNKLAGAGIWNIKELWSGNESTAEGSLTINVAGQDAQVFRLQK